MPEPLESQVPTAMAWLALTAAPHGLSFLLRSHRPAPGQHGCPLEEGMEGRRFRRDLLQRLKVLDGRLASVCCYYMQIWG